jgi:hypothetical protein
VVGVGGDRFEQRGIAETRFEAVETWESPGRYLLEIGTNRGSDTTSDAIERRKVPKKFAVKALPAGWTRPEPMIQRKIP